MASPWDLFNRNISRQFATWIAIAATAFYFVVAFNDYKASRERVTYGELESMRANTTFKELRTEIDRQNDRTARLVDELTQLAKTPVPNSSHIAQQLIVLRHDVDRQAADLNSVRNSVDSLDKLIESSPEKAITIPFLTKDLDDFKLSSQHDIDSLRAEMLRGYELNKWLIGLMLAAILALVLKTAFDSKTAATKGSLE